MAIQFVGRTTGSSTATTTWSVLLNTLTGGIASAPAEDDLVIVLHGASNVADLNPGVATGGYQELLDLYFNSPSRDIQASVSYKFMGSFPDSSVTLNSMAGSGAKSVTILVFRGVNRLNPFDTSATSSTAASTASQTNYPTPSITASTLAKYLVTGVAATFSANSTSTIAAPSGYTNSASQFPTTSSSAFTAMGYAPVSGSGTIASANWVRSGTATIGTSDSYATFALLLREEPVVPKTETFVEQFNSGAESLAWTTSLTGSSSQGFSSNFCEMYPRAFGGADGKVQKFLSPFTNYYATMVGSFVSFRYLAHGIDDGALSSTRARVINVVNSMELGVIFQANGTALPYGIVNGATTQGTAFSLALGDLIRFTQPTAGGSLYVHKSSDQGANWTLVFTYSANEGESMKAGTYFDVTANAAGTTSNNNGFLYWDDLNSGFVSTGALVGSTSTTLSTSGVLTGNASASGSTTTSLAASATLVGLLALSGATSLALGTTGTAVGKTAMSGATTTALATTATLQGSAPLTGSSTLVLTTAGDLKGQGPLAGAVTTALNTSATLAGQGNLAGSSALGFTTTGTLYNANQGGSTSLSLNALGTLLGTGDLAGASTLSLTGAGQLTGDGPLSGTTSTGLSTTGVLNGAGVLQGTVVTSFLPSSVNLVANGKLLANVDLSLAMDPATLEGAGALSGTTSLKLAPNAPRLVAVLPPGSTSLNFSTTGTMTGISLIQGSSSLDLDVGPAGMHGAGQLRGSVVASKLTTTGVLSTKRFITAKPATLKLTTAGGVLTGKKFMSGGSTFLSFFTTATIGTSQGQKFRDFWVAYYDARQKLLNAHVDKFRTDITANASATSALTTRVAATESSITSQATSITQLNASLSTKTTTFTQGTAPSTTGRVVGDLWIHTLQNNALYRWDGSAWSIVNLDAGITVFTQATAPTAKRIGDMWFKTSDNNKQYIWDGSAWVLYSDPRIDANSSAINTLNTSVSNINGTLSSQGTAITNLQTSVNDPNTGLTATSTAVTQLKTSSTYSTNLVPNSGFRTSIDGWNISYNQANDSNWIIGKNLPSTAYQIPFVNQIAVGHPNTPANNMYVTGSSPKFAVVPGKRYAAQALVARNSGWNEVIGVLEFFNSAGTSLGSVTLTWFNGTSEVTAVSSGFSGTPARGGWAPLRGFMVAPTNAVSATISMRGLTNGTATPYMWMCEPMVEIVSTDRTTVSPYSAGGAESFASWSVTLDVNGYVSGLAFGNNGTTSDFIVRADVFKIVSPGNAAIVPFEVVGANTYIKNAFIQNLTIGKLTTGTLNADMQMGTGRIIYDQGGYMKIEGAGFGAGGSNSFVEWYGPRLPSSGTIDPSLCTRANAKMYLATDGSAYFGGTLNAGTIRNAIRTTVTASNAQVTLGPYTTYGAPKQIILSFGATWDGYVAGQSASSIQTESYSSSVELYRQIGNDAEVLVGTYTYPGGASATQEFIPAGDVQDGGPAGWRTYFSRYTGGSTTITENIADNRNRTYRAVLVTRTLGTVTSQGLGIISIEE